MPVPWLFLGLMKKTQSTIHEFFKRKYVGSSSQDAEETTNLNDNIPPPSVPVTENPCKKAQMNSNDIDLSVLERDPGLRHQVYDYPVNQQDTIRRAYMNLGPLQPTLSVFPKSGPETHKRSFQASWFKLYPWIEYSQSLDAAFCFPCFLFNKPSGLGYYGQQAFTIDGFRNWKKLAFRGHNENPNSINKGNFLEMLEALGEFSTELKELFCRAPKYASYTSPMIQKEILNIISNKVRRMICEEIGGGRFCLLVDEALDQSHKEQMSVVLRFVNKEGLIIERFFGLVHVRDTMAQTLKDGIYSLLSHYNLDVKSIRGQGYDGAGNMRCQFKGLQALILRDCKYAYYVHCLAHRLKLALMAASQGVIALRKFFTHLSFVVNVVSASSKRIDQLRDAQVEHIAYLISIDELETGSGLNQIGTLQRAGDTRWSSHLRSVSSLIKMFSPTCEFLLKIVEEGTGPIREDADSAYEAMTTFDFALQRQDQDIFNALRLVASTQLLLQKMKDESWNDLLSVVKSFCQVRNIDIPDLSSSYRNRGSRARNEHSDHTLEHHYRVDIFYEAINCQLMELDHRFSDSAMELLHLASSLDPKNAYETFRSVDVLQVMEKFYPEDFSDHEKTILKMQLQHYAIDVVQHADYKKLTSIAELCQWLVRTRREITFDLIYRVIGLLLTLPVSTATTERSFSAMNIVKTRIQSKMEDEFLNDSLVLYIERELAEKITLDEIIEDFKAAKDR
ncbi:hypothetical protein OROGR_034096 [Orobanche gracilis]